MSKVNTKEANQVVVTDHSNDENQAVATTSPPTSGFKVGEQSDKMRTLMVDCANLGNSTDSQESGISNRLLALAKHYQESKFIVVSTDKDYGEKNDAASEKFLSVCSLEEKWIKSAEAGDLRRDKLPRCWVKPKSIIKAALEYGLDLSEYSSESALRKDVITLNGRKSSDPVLAGLKDMKDKLLGQIKEGRITQETALDLIHQMDAAIEAALSEVLPETPSKKAAA